MRALLRGAAVVVLVAAAAATPGAVAGPPPATSPPVVVLPALPGKTPRPATGQRAVALARANRNVPDALARPYKTELGWTAQWRRNRWWLVGVFESDWGTRFVVRASVVGGRYVRFGVGPTRAWILANAQPSVTTLNTRFDASSSAVAVIKARLLALPPPPPNSFPDFDPKNYTILDGAAELLEDAPVTDKPGFYPGGGGPLWYFVYYARDHRNGQNVVLPVTGINYAPVSEGSVETARGAATYGFWDLGVADNVPPSYSFLAGLRNWITGVIAARGWQPANWPSMGYDPSFTIPPFIPRPLRVTVAKALPGAKPHPAKGRQAVRVARANLHVVDVLAQPFTGGQGSWTAQWRGNQWWVVGVFSSEWGKRFVVPATVQGGWVRFGAGPGRQWILKHARPRLKTTLYTRLKPWSATSLMKTEMLALPPPTPGSVSQFDPANYSILAGAAKLVRDVRPTAASGPAWYFVYYATDRSTGKNVVLPVTTPSLGPLVETTYDTARPGSTAYGFEGFDVLLTVPSHKPALTSWIRSVVAKRGWHPTNFP